MKKCKKCFQYKELNSFYKKGEYYRGECIECWKNKQREYWRKSSRKYYNNNLLGKNKTIKNLGLTQEFYENKIKESGGKCEICGKIEELVVDHCHKNNIYRGLLCHKCNRGLGHFNDDIDLLKKCIKYLKPK